VRRLPAPKYDGFHVFLYAQSPEKSARFYQDLGFKLAMTHDLPGGLKVYGLTVGKTNFVIGPPAPFEGEATQAWLRHKPWGVGTVLMPSVKSADDLHTRALAIGAEVIEPPTDQSWGSRTVTIRDPEGYWLQFEQPLRQPKARPKPKAKAVKAKPKTAKRKR
jgi:catechol 2,3-dioxygenase-like lactoylglutathione lyase family enzyme